MKLKQKILIVLFSAVTLLPVQAAPYPHQSTITCRTASIPNTSTTVTLDWPCRSIVLKTTTSSAVLYFNLKGTECTSSNFSIEPGGSYSWSGSDPIKEFTILGASATGNYSVEGHY